MYLKIETIAKRRSDKTHTQDMYVYLSAFGQLLRSIKNYRIK